MRKLKFAAAVLCMALALGVTGASPAAACQGPQFESRFVLFYAKRQAEPPRGLVQYRVRITNYSLRDVYSRDLVHVQQLADEPPSEGEIDKAVGNLKIIKPIGTSCQSLSMPEPGIYYVSGSLALREDGSPVVVNGGELFYPRYERVKVFPDFGQPLVPAAQ